MRTIIFLFVLFLFTSSLSAQHQCGNHSAEVNTPYLRQLNKIIQNSPPQQRNATSMNFVPVQLHIIRTSAGTGGLDAAVYEAALDEVNKYYKNAQIHFYQCAAINYIDDDTYYDYDKSEMNALDAAHSVANVINIYTTDNCTSGANNICGHAQFPGGLDFVMLDNDCTINGSTFAHELGHYFYLLHTHETAVGAELVDGSNCTTTGDWLCDTPADPTLSSVVDAGGCIYTGTATDANGDSYTPDVNNVMSYVTRICRYSFTSGQYSRMLNTLQTSRTYLTCGSAPTLDAEFYYDYSTSCNTGLSVDFCDITEAEADSWSWDFGDSNSSSSQSPTHTYNTAGTYNVALTATKGASSDTETKNYIVTVGAKSLPYSQDFEAGTSIMGDFIETVTMKNNVSIAASAAKDGSMGLLLEGYDGSESPYFSTPTSATAFSSDWNYYFKSLLEICIDATNATGLSLDFDMNQLYGYNSNYTNFRITANGTQVGSVYQPADEPSEATWQAISVDLSAYDGTVVTIGFEASNKYSEDYQTTNGNATYIDNIVINATALPVELSSFNGYWNEKQQAVALQWRTESEQNNDVFIIERSQDGKNWQNIDQIKGHETSFEPVDYRYSDPTASPGLNYYRLRQIDFDTSFEYSEWVAVEVPYSSLSIKIYPNPAKDHLIIETEEEIAVLQLRSTLGQLIQPVFHRIAQGYRLDTNALPKGIYWLEGETGILGKVVIHNE